MRRVDQNALIDAFLNATASHDELSDTSFLTALDLEASLQQQQPPPMLLDSGANTPPLSREYSRENGGRSPPPNEAQGGARQAFSDLRRFGTFFGAALGRRRGDTDDRMGNE